MIGLGIAILVAVGAAIYFLSQKLNQLKDTIMATQAQLAADLQAVNAQLVKVSSEITSVQSSVDTLNVRIAELEEIINNGGEVGQELTDAVAAVKAQAQVVDEQIPDLPVTLPPAQ